MKRYALLLCIILCLCAAAASAGTARGRYVEEAIDLPFEGDISFACAGGTVYYVDAKSDTLFYSADLDSWEATAISREGRNAGVNGVAISPDGDIYLSSGWAWPDKDGYPQIERVKDGESNIVRLDQTLDTGTDRLVLCALPSGETMGLSDTRAYRFSPDGVTKQEYAVLGGEAMAVYENEVAICQTRDSRISVLDIETGQLLRALPLPSGVSGGLSQIAYDLNGALYYVGPDGLYQSNAGSFIMTRIADGRLMTASKPSVEARALLFDGENNPAVAYSRGGEIALVSYRYDENAATQPDKLLSVFSLYDSRTLREWANQFQIKYPEVLVDIITPPKGTAMTRDDAIHALNTEILAGKGPDVLVLDGLPMKSYVEKGALADISSVVRPMLYSGELLENIAGVFAGDGAVYAVPTRFLIPSIWGDAEGLNTLDDMADWALSHPDALAYYAIDAQTLIGTFYPSCAPAWFGEDGRLDEASIEAFLKALKVIRGRWTFEEISRELGWGEFEFGYGEWRALAGEWNPYTALAEGHMWEELQGVEFFAAGTQRQLPFLLRGLDAASFPNGAMAANVKGAFAPLPGQAEGCFMPKLTLGASKNAALGDIALKFIEYALGEQSQNADLMEGFPVNIRALDKAQARGQTLFGISGGCNDTDWTTAWLDASRQKQLRGIIESLATPVIPDFTLFQMLVRESEPFFDGKLSSEQAARNVCAKANAYLAE